MYGFNFFVTKVFRNFFQLKITKLFLTVFIDKLITVCDKRIVFRKYCNTFPIFILILEYVAS